MRKENFRSAIQMVALAAVYFVAAWLGLMMDAVSGFATLVWAPTGIALAALLLGGLRLWPGVFAAAFAVNVLTGAPVWVALGVATGNTLEVVLAVTLLRRLTGFEPALQRLKDATGLIIWAAVVSTCVSATVGTASLWFGGIVSNAQFGETWRAWWLGDAIGDLVVAPLLLIWVARKRRWLPRVLELSALVVCLVAASALVFAGLAGLSPTRLPYLFFPLLMWASFRFGQRAAVTVTFVLSALAIVCTSLGYGPFIHSELSQSLFALQTFMGVTAATFLFLGAVISERREALGALKDAQLDLESRVHQRTAALSKAHDQLEEAQEIAHVGSWEWDIAANQVTWSDELYRIYGLTPQEFGASYEGFLERVHADDRERVGQVVQGSFRTGQSFDMVHRVVRPNGAVRVISARGRVMVDEANRPLRMMGTGKDITESQLTEDELRRAHEDLERRVTERTAELAEALRARDSFVSVASHELRTPLSALQLQVQLLNRKQVLGQGDRAASGRLETIERQVTRLGKLIDNLLDVSRMTAGKLQLEIEEVDLASAVREVVARFDDELKRSGAVVRLKAEQNVTGQWDRLRLEQIVTNLLSNAIKYGGEKPIEIVVDANERIARLIVSDFGIGIARDDQPRIFERFKRLVPERQVTGFGLGLWIVQQIVDALHGTIRVVSEVNCGSSFIVELPRVGLALGDEASAVRQAEASTEMLDRRADQVLLIEDDEDMAGAVADALRDQGYFVVCTGNGQEALDYLRHARPRPQLILLDVTMPVMNAEQFLAVRGSNASLASIPVVLLSGNTQLKQKAQELNVEGFLQKPVDMQQLVAAVHQHCVAVGVPSQTVNPSLDRIS